LPAPVLASRDGVGLVFDDGLFAVSVLVEGVVFCVCWPCAVFVVDTLAWGWWKKINHSNTQTTTITAINHSPINNRRRKSGVSVTGSYISLCGPHLVIAMIPPFCMAGKITPLARECASPRRLVKHPGQSSYF